MALALRHRGPDHQGVWVDPKVGIVLCHRRLAILDVSPLGHQPMLSNDQRYVIVFNGEIYNFQEIRSDLQGLGHQFRGHSDTEILLAAIAQWGLEKALQRSVGMFALALWDRQERVLSLARDRVGEKPLYYGWSGGIFLFGSELKALRAHPHWGAEIDRNSLALYLRHNYVPTPYSIYKGISKLVPGCILILAERDLHDHSTPEPRPYWSLGEGIRTGAGHAHLENDRSAIQRLDELLRRAVSQQMVADVPLGAFLSGGVDSSTIVALMQAQSTRPVKTFTIGFHDASYNEAQHARAVASHLGTEHTELYVTPKEAQAVIPRLPEIYDEPFADISQIPTFLVSELARRGVTVSLSGDGGDELFGGYPRYAQVSQLWRRIGWLPQAARLAATALIHRIPAPVWESLLGWMARYLPGPRWSGRVGDRLHKLAELFPTTSPEAIYLRFMSICQPAQFIPGAQEPPTVLSRAAFPTDEMPFYARMMYLDFLAYLPDDILVKVDRAAMAVSLETRVPLLDHRLIEFAWSLPLKLKVRGGQSKWLLREVLYRYVPRELIERPKMGFGVPIGDWLCGPLRGWAESLLHPARLREEGFLAVEPVQRKWREHLSGTRNWGAELWILLMFQAWHEGQKASAPTIRSGS
jgi:asparagine synthase (glutamine-hydrolysing)